LADKQSSLRIEKTHSLPDPPVCILIDDGIHMINLSAAARRVYRIDTFRQSADGVSQPLFESVMMLIAIRYFAVGDFGKGLISASNFLGFLASAPLTGVLNRSAVPRSRVLSLLTGTAAVMMALGAFSGSGIAFSISVSLASAAVHIRQPFFTDLYRENYPPDHLATLISLGLRLNLLLSLFCGLFYGRLLTIDIGHWRFILIASTTVLLLVSLVLPRLSGNPPVSRHEGWLQAMMIPFRNPTFLYVQTSWMIIGFGNLWIQPLRSIYLVEEQRGLALSPTLVMTILVVIPVATRLLCNPIWARLYQKMSFPALRISINLFFMTSIPLFFLTENLYLVALASFLLGVGTSASPFIWQLWVTKIAPPSETRIYQSAHAFLAGFRGVVAPFIGLAVLQSLSFQKMSFLSGILIFVATLMMIPLMRKDRKF